MSRWLQMARAWEENRKPLPDTRQEPAESPTEPAPLTFLPVSAGCRVEKSEQAAPAPSAPAHSRADGNSPFRHGRSVAGIPVTWTGKVVSLDEWRRLSEWERHGSTGKVWNGLTRQWEPMGGGAA